MRERSPILRLPVRRRSHPQQESSSSNLCHESGGARERAGRHHHCNSSAVRRRWSTRARERIQERWCRWSWRASWSRVEVLSGVSISRDAPRIFCVRSSVARPNEDRAVLQQDFKRRDRFDGRHAHGRSRAEVELRTMPGTGDRTIDHGAVRQWLAIVRADIFNREELVPHSNQQGRDIFHEDRQPTAGGNLIDGRDSLELGHAGRSFSVSRRTFLERA